MYVIIVYIVFSVSRVRRFIGYISSIHAKRIPERTFGGPVLIDANISQRTNLSTKKKKKDAYGPRRWQIGNAR